jgi:hypothetical protein
MRARLVLAAYRFLPRGDTGAIGFVLFEASAAVLLIPRDPRIRRVGATTAIVVAVAWSVLGLAAFARGLTVHNCGCFGIHLVQPLRWWVLAEDAEFLALAGWVRLGMRSADRFSPQRQSPSSELGAFEPVDQAS